MTVWLLVAVLASPYRAETDVQVSPKVYPNQASCLAAGKQIHLTGDKPQFSYVLSYFCVQGVIVQETVSK